MDKEEEGCPGPTWGKRGEIIGTVLCCTVYCSCAHSCDKFLQVGIFSARVSLSQIWILTGVFGMYFLLTVVSTSATDCLERLVSE